MSTIDRFSREDINQNNPLISNFKTIIETAFYGNNVKPIKTVADAYYLAEQSPATIVTDLPVYEPKKLGIPDNGKILVDNHGQVVGRTAAARCVISEPHVDKAAYAGILREAVYRSCQHQYYKSDIFVGLGENFMLRGHIMLPEGFESNLYSYLLNFQLATSDYEAKYRASRVYHENDIFVFGDPYWTHPDYPHGLTIFDPEHNVAAILGLRYFGEFKKATLTLAWATAHRNGFVACHGGLKQYTTLQNTKFTMAAFGLSGSGKSTITLAKHQNEFPVTVLHDDAFVIDSKDGSTVALEPSYFDKTQDYPMTSDVVKYFLTVQNVGVTLDEKGKKVLVTEDIRNGNGRTVKSRFVTPNRVDSIEERIDAVFWIMKDDSLPPVVQIEDPVLAAVFGATLATKRSTAENVVPGTDLNSLVIEPFANPFRAYPLAEDYNAFKQLFETQKTKCFILNTGSFGGKNILPAHTLGCIEAIIDESVEFKDFGPLTSMSYLPITGIEPDMNNPDYLLLLKKRMENRLAFVQSCRQEKQGYNALPEETSLLLQHLILELEAKLN